MKFTEKSWMLISLTLTAVILAAAAVLTAVVDPCFHFHEPLKSLQYPLKNQRYQNDGIVRHFDYDAIITGSSLTENFKASEFNELFGVNAVKVCYSGSTYKEINDNLAAAVRHNPKLKVVLRGLDYGKLTYEADTITPTGEEYPTFLYDDNPWNDVRYLLNKSILLDYTMDVFRYTAEGKKTTSFDDYSFWGRGVVFGREAIDRNYIRTERSGETELHEPADWVFYNVRNSLEQNVIRLAQENPDIDFYIFFPPTSIFDLDSRNQQNRLHEFFVTEKYAIEQLLPYENICLYAFMDEFDLVCNQEIFKDLVHFTPEINSQLLRWIREDTHRLTEENYREYCDRVYDFYMNYDFDALYPEQ